MTLLLLAGAVMAVSCTGAGESSGRAVVTPTPDATAAAVGDYADCLRDEGIDVEGPQIASDGSLASWPAYEAGDQTSEAEASCAADVQEIAFALEGEAALFVERATEFVQCLRDEGFENVPDPTSEGIRIPRRVEVESKEWREAERKCMPIMEEM